MESAEFNIKMLIAQEEEDLVSKSISEHIENFIFYLQAVQRQENYCLTLSSIKKFLKTRVNIHKTWFCTSSFGS